MTTMSTAVGTTAPAPIARPERITALDTLRGFAVLGILLINITAFGMFHTAWDDPAVTGGATGMNLWTWLVFHVLAEGKMRALFSMVFGASAILLTSRLERIEVNSGDIYYRRTLWLMLFGIAHAYLLWWADILYSYALCGLALYPFRKLAPRVLLVIGIALAVGDSAWSARESFKARAKIGQARAAEEAAAHGRHLSQEQEDLLKEWREWRSEHRPSPDELAKDAARWRGNVLSVLQARAELVPFFHEHAYYSPASGNLDYWSMMFTGMALFRWGLFGAARSKRFYAWMTLIGLGVGLPLNCYTGWAIVRTNFDPVTHDLINWNYHIARSSVALGYVGLIMLVCKTGMARRLTSLLSAVGQMAFTNYILQSVLCTFVFTGPGLGLYGRLERYQLYFVVAAIWLFLLITSARWLRYFRIGPLEWCWRSLTYWKRQPLKVTRAVLEAGPS